MFGWSRKRKRLIGQLKLIRPLSKLNKSLLICRIAPKPTWERTKRIDIWWRGGSNNGNLVLSLIKFIRISYEWRNATVRLLIVNPENAKKKMIKKQARGVLDKMRIDAEIIVLNNELDKSPVNKLIKKHSADADLIFLGIPEIQEGMEKEFIKRTDAIYKDLNTLVLVKASSFFSVLKIGS